MENALLLPVSLGEAVDKLSILDIKLARINDHRREDVLVEYNLLLEKLKSFIVRHQTLYAQMKRVNELIWDLMTPLRDANLDDVEYLKLAKKCIELNDIRFRVKHKINTVGNSHLKEQKGYHIRTVLIEISCIGDDLVPLVNAIKYYALLHDRVVVINQPHLKPHFSQDPNVVFTAENVKYDKRFTINCALETSVYQQFEITDYELFKALTLDA